VCFEAFVCGAAPRRKFVLADWPDESPAFLFLDGQSTEELHIEPASLDNALEGTYWDGLAAMHRHDYLPSVWMPPFLMTA